MPFTFSIIIPVLNEAAQIETCLMALQPLRSQTEIIVVDGSSTDNTIHLARPWVDTVLRSPPGRAKQMNLGANAAYGDILVFLHADTFLPDNALTLIQQHLEYSQHDWGRFDVCLDSPHYLVKTVALMMNWRSRLTGIATGDQVIFVKRSTFFAIGQYPDMALMEDIALSAKLKTICKPIYLTAKVTSSARRWHQHGIIKTIMLMWWLRLCYFFGTDVNNLARIYRKR